MKTTIRTLVVVALIVTAYLLGTWNVSGKSEDSSLISTETTDSIRSKSSPENSIEQLPGNLTNEERSTIAIFEEAAPSVVFITTSRVRRDFWTMNVMEIPQGNGSGFVWDEKGHIVTNHHVVRGADRIQVTLADQTTWEAEKIGEEPSKDLALLRLVEVPKNKLKPLKSGYSGNLVVGQNVYAIGNPFGLDQTLTKGIISALGRQISAQNGVPIKDVIQTDAAINPGNSGGPLLNSSGELIGVNTAIYSPSGAYAGIGFSIPVNVVKWVVPDLIKYGRLNRPVLGIEIASAQLKARIGLKSGVMIWDITNNGPADRIGLLPTRRDRDGYVRIGDIITAIDEHPIVKNEDLILTLEKYRPGDEVTLTVIREEEEFRQKVELSGY
jgi:S1-C subfamily serine protease